MFLFLKWNLIKKVCWWVVFQCYLQRTQRLPQPLQIRTVVVILLKMIVQAMVIVIVTDAKLIKIATVIAVRHHRQRQGERQGEHQGCPQLEALRMVDFSGACSSI